VIVSVKKKLFKVLDDIHNAGHVIDGKHRLVQCIADDKKRKLDVDDLLSLYADLDAVVAPISTFTARNLRHILPFEPDATDFCSLAMTVRQLQFQMAVLQGCSAKSLTVLQM